MPRTPRKSARCPRRNTRASPLVRPERRSPDGVRCGCPPCSIPRSCWRCALQRRQRSSARAPCDSGRPLPRLGSGRAPRPARSRRAECAVHHADNPAEFPAQSPRAERARRATPLRAVRRNARSCAKARRSADRHQRPRARPPYSKRCPLRATSATRDETRAASRRANPRARRW